jgi:hypothetical protein
LPARFATGEAQRAYRVLRQKYDKLMADYRKWEQGLTDLARDRPQFLTGFDPSQPMPDNPNFWASADTQINAPRADFRTKGDDRSRGGPQSDQRSAPTRRP